MEEEFDLDELAALVSILELEKLENELKNKNKEENSSQQNSNKDENLKSTSTKDDLIFLYPNFKDFANNLSEETFEVFLSIINNLDLMFGKNWEFVPLNSTVCQFTVYFDKITVENEKNVTHDISDFFIRFHILSNLKLHGSIQGARSTITLEEYNYSNREGTDCYIHSHLKGYKGSFIEGQFYNFCLGSSELASVVEHLVSSNNLDYLKINWYKFITYLEPLARNESLEGTPYRYIKEIKKASSILNLNEILGLTRISDEFELKLNDFKVIKFIQDFITVTEFDKFNLDFKLNFNKERYKEIFFLNLCDNLQSFELYKKGLALKFGSIYFDMPHDLSVLKKMYLRFVVNIEDTISNLKKEEDTSNQSYEVVKRGKKDHSIKFKDLEFPIEVISYKDNSKGINEALEWNQKLTYIEFELKPKFKIFIKKLLYNNLIRNIYEL